MAGRLEGRRVLVIGASAGLGRASGLAIAAEGGRVAFAARRGERLEEARRLGFRSAAVPVGSIDPEAVPGVKVHEIRDVGQLGRKIRPE